MKPKTAIVLVVILVVLLAAILARQVIRQRQADKLTVAKADVWPAEIGEVKAIKIAPADGKPMRIERVEDKWRIVEPISAAADEATVSRVVDPIKTLTFKRSYEPGQAEAPGDGLTGLDKPRWKVTLTDSDGAEHVLLVGKPVPLSAGRETYVRRGDGKTTYVVAVNFADRLDKPVSDFRSKNVLNLDKNKIAKISIVGPEKLELVKTDGLWGITQPIPTAADNDQVELLLSKMANLSVSEFVEDDPETLRPYGLEPGTERLVVRVWTKAEPATTQPETRPAVPEKTYALALGSKTEDKRYAKLVDSPAVFLVRQGLLDDLQVTLADLRDMQVMAVAAEQVVKVELDLPAGKAELVKKDDVWRMVSPYEGPANGDAVDNLLSDIDRLEAESMRDDVQMLDRYGLAEPVGSITIHQAGKSDKQILLIGSASPSGEMTFVKRASSNATAVVKTADLKPILADPAAYWATRLIKVPDQAEAQTLNIIRPDGDFTLVKTDGDWKMTAPLAAEAEPINVEKILSKLRDLKARKIVSLGGEVPSRYVKANKKMEVSFSVVEQPPAPTTAQTQPATQPTSKPAPATHTYRINLAQLTGKTYAWIPGSEPTFVGECYGGLWKTLMSELRDRSVWQLATDKINKINLTAGATKLELVRQEDTWKYTPDPYVDIDGGKIKKFLDDIRLVKAERFASHEPVSDDDAKKFGLDKPWFTLSVTDEDGKVRKLTVSNKGADKTANRYAVAADIQGVLVISSETAGKMAVKLKDFKE